MKKSANVHLTVTLIKQYSCLAENFILRCSKDEDAYKDTVYWLNKLSVCEISIPIVLSEGKQIAKEVIAIQRKVSRIDISTDEAWTWNCVIDEMLNRAEERIKGKHYFDSNKIYIIKKLQREIQEYLDKVQPTPYLDDMLTFVAMTKVALLNMDLDTKYIDYLLDEIHPNKTEYKAFVFYCLIYCVDFMGERGMQFLDKTVPVNESIIKRLNDIFAILMEEWNKCCEQ